MTKLAEALSIDGMVIVTFDHLKKELIIAEGFIVSAAHTPTIVKPIKLSNGRIKMLRWRAKRYFRQMGGYGAYEYVLDKRSCRSIPNKSFITI